MVMEMIKASTILISGIIFVFVGVLLLIIGSILQSASKAGEVHTGGIVLIGPIPIIFGNDKSLIIGAVIFAIIIMVLWYLLFYRTAT